MDRQQTNTALLRRLQSEPDKHAWLEFWKQYRPLFVGAARRCGLQEADVDDVVHEAIMRVWGGLEKFKRRRVGSFRRWLKVIATNLALDLQREASRLNTTSEDPTESSVDDLSQQRLEHKEVLELANGMLVQASAKVQSESPDDWAAFEAVQLHGLPTNVAAKRLGVAVSTVSRRVRRTRERLIEELWRNLDPDTREVFAETFGKWRENQFEDTDDGATPSSGETSTDSE